MQIVSDEIYRIIEREVSNYVPVATEQLEKEYVYGPSDLILQFHTWQGNPQVRISERDNPALAKQTLQKPIVNVRLQMLAKAWHIACKKHNISHVDIHIPVCFSDSSDMPLQKYPCLVFSKAAYSSNILMPSLNNFVHCHEIDQLEVCDTPIETKTNKMCFAGSFTGNTTFDLSNNPRLRLAAFAAENPDITECWIGRPPGEAPEVFEKKLKEANDLYFTGNIIQNTNQGKSIQEQIQHKYQLVADGHTCAWARLPWQMYSNCVPIKVRNHKRKNIEWFYHLLDFSKHCIEVGIEELKEVYEELEKRPRLQKDIAEAGKDFVKKYWTQDLAIDVFAQTMILLNQKQLPIDRI
jgi:hypothetical protein